MYTRQPSAMLVGGDLRAAAAAASSKMQTTTQRDLPMGKKQQQQHQRQTRPKPRRPLSAYNIFFKQERGKMLADGSYDPSSADPASDPRADTANALLDKIIANKGRLAPQSSSPPPPSAPPSVPYRTGPPGGGGTGDEARASDKSARSQASGGGRVSYPDLARTISRKWKALDPSSRSVFEALALLEKKKYDRELDMWEKELAAEAERDERALLKKQMPGAGLSSNAIEGAPPASSLAGGKATRSASASRPRSAGRGSRPRGSKSPARGRELDRTAFAAVVDPSTVRTMLPHMVPSSGPNEGDSPTASSSQSVSDAMAAAVTSFSSLTSSVAATTGGEGGEATTTTMARTTLPHMLGWKSSRGGSRSKSKSPARGRRAAATASDGPEARLMLPSMAAALRAANRGARSKKKMPTSTERLAKDGGGRKDSNGGPIPPEEPPSAKAIKPKDETGQYSLPPSMLVALKAASCANGKKPKYEKCEKGPAGNGSWVMPPSMAAALGKASIGRKKTGLSHDKPRRAGDPLGNNAKKSDGQSWSIPPSIAAALNAANRKGGRVSKVGSDASGSAMLEGNSSLLAHEDLLKPEQGGSKCDKRGNKNKCSEPSQGWFVLPSMAAALKASGQGIGNVEPTPLRESTNVVSTERRKDLLPSDFMQVQIQQDRLLQPSMMATLKTKGGDAASANPLPKRESTSDASLVGSMANSGREEMTSKLPHLCPQNEVHHAYLGILPNSLAGLQGAPRALGKHPRENDVLDEIKERKKSRHNKKVAPDQSRMMGHFLDTDAQGTWSEAAFEISDDLVASIEFANHSLCSVEPTPLAQPTSINSSINEDRASLFSKHSHEDQFLCFPTATITNEVNNRSYQVTPTPPRGASPAEEDSSACFSTNKEMGQPNHPTLSEFTNNVTSPEQAKEHLPSFEQGCQHSSKNIPSSLQLASTLDIGNGQIETWVSDESDVGSVEDYSKKGRNCLDVAYGSKFEPNTIPELQLVSPEPDCLTGTDQEGSTQITRQRHQPQETANEWAIETFMSELFPALEQNVSLESLHLPGKNEFGGQPWNNIISEEMPSHGDNNCLLVDNLRQEQMVAVKPTPIMSAGSQHRSRKKQGQGHQLALPEFDRESIDFLVNMFQ